MWYVLERRPDCAYRLSGESRDYTREVIELPAPQPVEVLNNQNAQVLVSLLWAVAQPEEAWIWPAKCSGGGGSGCGWRVW